MFFASSTARLKTTLRLCLARLKLIKNKKTMQIQVLKKEVADLLEAGKDESASIRGTSPRRRGGRRSDARTGRAGRCAHASVGVRARARPRSARAPRHARAPLTSIRKNIRARPRAQLSPSSGR